MPNDDVGTAGGDDHGAADLAGKCTLFFPVHILGADLDIAALGRLDCRQQSRIGWRDHDLAV